MKIRQPEDVEDLRAAMEARNRAWRVGFRGIVPGDVIEAELRPTDDANLQVLDEEIAAEPGPFLLAVREGAVVGFVRARYTGTSDYVAELGGEVVDLVVDPAEWRDGVGSTLFASAVDWLPNMIDGVTVAVLAENERARSFLEANDLAFEESVEAEVGGETFEHAVYRVGFED